MGDFPIMTAFNVQFTVVLVVQCQPLVRCILQISMLDGILFDKLDAIAKEVRGNNTPFGGLQLILSGTILGKTDVLLSTCCHSIPH